MKLPKIELQATSPAPAEPPPVLDIEVRHDLSLLLHNLYFITTMKPRPNPWKRRVYAFLLFAGLAFLGWNSIWATEAPEKTIQTYFGDLFSAASLPLWQFLLFLLLMAVLFGLLVDWFQRRLVLRAYKRLGYPPPLSCTYHFNAGGITRIEPHYRLMTPWSHIQPLSEIKEALVFGTSYAAEPILIPKAQLTPETRQAIAYWEAHRLSRVAPSDRSSVPHSLAGENRFELGVPKASEAEVIEMFLYAHRHANPWGTRFREVIPLLPIVLLCVPVYHIALWAIDPYGLPWQVALPLFLEMLTSTFVWPMLIILGVFLAFVACLPLLWRLQAKSVAKKFAERPGNSDFDLIVGEHGVCSDAPTGTGFYAWQSLNAMHRTESQIFMIFGRNFIFTLPLRVMNEEAIARIEALASHALTNRRREA